MKKLILLLLFIPIVSFGQTYKVESKKNYDNTTTVKVTKQGIDPEKYQRKKKVDNELIESQKAVAESVQGLANTISDIARDRAERREAEAKRLGYSSAAAYSAVLKRSRKSYRDRKKKEKFREKYQKKKNKEFAKTQKEREKENLKSVKKNINSSNQSNNELMTVNQAKERVKILENMYNEGDISKEQYKKYSKKYIDIIERK